MKSTPAKTIPIIPIHPSEVDAGTATVTTSLYAAQEKIYPRSVAGRFANWRWGMVFLTQIVFYGLPWLEWGQRQAVNFDLGSRRFYIFGLVLYQMCIRDSPYTWGILLIK